MAFFYDVDGGFVEPGRQSVVGDGACSFVAEAGNGRVVASIEARHIGDEIEIVMLATDLSVRRQGVGSQLLNALLARATEHRATRIILDVAADNIPARALYAAHDFTEIARRRGYYRKGRDGATCDALLLERRMTGGAGE